MQYVFLWAFHILHLSLAHLILAYQSHYASEHARLWLHWP